MANFFKQTLIVIAAGFALTVPAHGATPSEAFSCQASYSASMASLGSLTKVSSDSGEEDDYDWGETYYNASSVGVLAWMPTSIKYYWEEDIGGASDGFISYVPFSYDLVSQEVFARLGVSSCSKMNDKTCVLPPSSTGGALELTPLDANTTKIACWFDD
jgi:hypothetical protein